MFNRDSYVKIVDTEGNYRFGFIRELKDRGFVFVIDLNEEGLSKIEYDNEAAVILGMGPKNFLGMLTETEQKVVPLIGALKNTKEIGAIMKISPTTVRAHIRDLKIKLGCSTREQLIALCQGIYAKLEWKLKPKDENA